MRVPNALTTVQQRLSTLLPRALQPWFGTHAEPFDRLRGATVLAYVIASLVSVTWSIGARADTGRLDAVLSVGATAQGTVFITLHNDSRVDWTHVEITADDRYYHRIDRVDAGRADDVRIELFRDRFEIPRPPDMFLWEGVGEEGLPEGHAPASYRPARVTLSADQGTFEPGEAP
jgi:hypothetical protein